MTTPGPDTAVSPVAPVASSGFWHHGVPAEPGSLLALRRDLARWLGSVGIRSERADDIVLASYEALANVVEHAYVRPRAGSLDLAARFDEGDACVEVVVGDRGRWAAGPPDPLRGNGLRLIDSLADDVEIARGDAGTVVRMSWAAHPNRRDALW
ncbi:ATP-binding protein [Rhodococcus sp. HNM0569]|uniref:ATP-binding protein n=1 Tax=Rhodococcus sp. HNM0569 TaxID=2716340 RepID=UPI00146B7A2F|nr:ATP-binding protein [Rhodococcus sp. HNM0569]NLU82494.1 ATP-binding protein [Rhodococcus sp. HNM0569]